MRNSGQRTPQQRHSPHGSHPACLPVRLEDNKRAPSHQPLDPATPPGDSLPRPLRRASGDRQLALGDYFSAWTFRVFETFVFIGSVIACCVDGSFIVMVRLMSISDLITLASAKS